MTLLSPTISFLIQNIKITSTTVIDKCRPCEQPVITKDNIKRVIELMDGTKIYFNQNSWNELIQLNTFDKVTVTGQLSYDNKNMSIIEETSSLGIPFDSTIPSYKQPPRKEPNFVNSLYDFLPTVKKSTYPHLFPIKESIANPKEYHNLYFKLYNDYMIPLSITYFSMDAQMNKDDIYETFEEEVFNPILNQNIIQISHKNNAMTYFFQHYLFKQLALEFNTPQTYEGYPDSNAQIGSSHTLRKQIYGYHIFNNKIHFHGYVDTFLTTSWNDSFPIPDSPQVVVTKSYDLTEENQDKILKVLKEAYAKPDILNFIQSLS